MRAVIDKLSGGLVQDQVDYNLPEGYFSDGRNVRFRDDSAEKVKGNEAVFGSLSVTAIWAKYIADNTGTHYWAYGNESVVYATDGTTHANISSVSYNCPADTGYTGTAFRGYLVISDTVAVPQQWNPSLSNKLQPLSAWPASTSCKVIRSFSDFLVALAITQSGTYNPRLIRWSDAAPFGALPGSWDYTDPTNQAGITELGQTSDSLIDCLALRDSNIVYKQNSTYLMQYVGGVDVFAFRQLFSQFGMLSENCGYSFGTSHLLVSDSDILIHDGSSAQSIADGRYKRWFFNSLNATQYNRVFVVGNRDENEIWICFPESGHDYPNLALAWNRTNNTFHVRELGTDIAHAEEGIVVGSSGTFDGLTGTFDEQAGQFSDYEPTPFSQRLILWNGIAKQALQADSGETLNGTPMTCYVERSNMGLTRDVGSIKRIMRVLPKVLGTLGDTFKVYIGARTAIDGTVTYYGPYNFTIGVDYKIDCRISARWLSLKFETQTTNSWRLSGFDLEFIQEGWR
jgi:hypothetical protein